MDPRIRRAQLLKDAQHIVDRAKDAGRDLTNNESAEVESILTEVKATDAQIEAERKSADLLARMTGAKNISFEEEEAEALGHLSPRAKDALAGTHWAKSVTHTLARTASGMGVKALLNGEVTVPPAVQIVPLPETPTRLLDLIQRERMDAHDYSYLRQVLRDDNAAVVPDNAEKPTSIYTFAEIKDHARVVAHLSEPFPLRYLTDYAAMAQVLDTEMREGVLKEVERQFLAGDGVGENFTGILNTTGVVDVPFVTDVFTTARTAITELQSRGENPTAWVLNPVDAAKLDLTRENGTSGGWLMSSGAFDVVFGQGIRRVTSNAIPAGTALLADWSTLRLGVREAEHTLAATQAGDLFKKNQVMLRSEGRYAPKIYRPQAIAVVHLTA